MKTKKKMMTMKKMTMMIMMSKMMMKKILMCSGGIMKAMTIRSIIHLHIKVQEYEKRRITLIN